MSEGKNSHKHVGVRENLDKMRAARGITIVNMRRNKMTDHVCLALQQVRNDIEVSEHDALGQS